MSAGYMKKHFDSAGRPKKAFATRQLAETFRRSRIASGVWRADKTNTYLCNWCGQYHAGRLGRNNRGGGRKIQQKGGPRWLPTQ